jgi:hypothetical protein
MDAKFEELAAAVDRRAAYKIDVHLVRVDNQWRGHLLVLKSSSHYNDEMENLVGGGDESMMWCVKCHGLVPPENIRQDVGLCSTCMRAGRIGEMLADHIKFAHGDVKKLASKIYSLLMQLDFDADIYLRRYKESMLRAIHEMKEHGTTPKYYKLLAKSRSNREPVVYERHRLEKDVADGSGALKKLEAFLVA